jgi:hypothetical protein
MTDPIPIPDMRAALSRHPILHRLKAIPRYRDLFDGKPATVEGLLQIVRQFPCFVWLKFLSRLQTLIHQPGRDALTAQSQAFHGIAGPELRLRFAKYAAKYNAAGITFAFSAQQIETLQQLAILHAPGGDNTTELTHLERDAICAALLMVWELLQPRSTASSEAETTSALAYAALQSHREFNHVLTARAFRFYRIGEHTPAEHIAHLQQAFRLATGVCLEDYILGGAELHLLEETKSVDAIAESWAPVAPFLGASSPKPWVRAFVEASSGSIDTIRAEAIRVDGTSNIDCYTLNAFSKYPLVQYDKKGTFVLSLPRIGRCLFEGVRARLMEACEGGRLNRTTKADVGGWFGAALEEYLARVLTDALGDRAIRIPAGPTRRADFILLEEGAVVVIEAKSAYGDKTYRNHRTLHQRTENLAALRIGEAADQIANTITELRSYTLKPPGLHELDWTRTRIVPVVVSTEKLPQVYGMKQCYDQVSQSLNKLALQSQLVPLRVLNIAEIERFPDLGKKHHLSTLLSRWATDPQFAEWPFGMYLSNEDFLCQQEYMKAAYGDVLRSLGSHHGFSPESMRFLQEQ